MVQHHLNGQISQNDIAVFLNLDLFPNKRLQTLLSDSLSQNNLTLLHSKKRAQPVLLAALPLSDYRLIFLV